MRARPKLKRFETFSAYIDQAEKYMDQQDELIDELKDYLININNITLLTNKSSGIKYAMICGVIHIIEQENKQLLKQ